MIYVAVSRSFVGEIIVQPISPTTVVEPLHGITSRFIMEHIRSHVVNQIRLERYNGNLNRRGIILATTRWQALVQVITDNRTSVST
jgi:hypothetical protein